jgi:hypothetical protein
MLYFSDIQLGVINGEEIMTHLYEVDKKLVISKIDFAVI